MKAESKFNLISKNGRIYTEDCFKNIKQNIPIKLGTDTNFSKDLRPIIGYATIKDVNNNAVTLDLDINSDYCEQYLQVVPFGIGEVKDNIVTNYKFISFDIVPANCSAVDGNIYKKENK